MRKGLKITAWILGLLAILLLAGLVAIQSPAVQTALGKRIVGIIQKGTDASIEFGDLSIRPMEAIILRDLVVRDIGGAPSAFGGRVRQGEWGGGPVLFDRKAPNVLYLPDAGGLYRIGERACLFVPGAFSVDGALRVMRGWPYESQEQLTPDEAAALLEAAHANRVDYVLSHTCPLSWERHFRDLFLPGVDQSRVDRSMEAWMDELLDVVAPSLRGWYFGHFHDDRSIPAEVPACMVFRRLVELG